MCVASVPGDHGSQKRAWDHLKLGLRMCLSGYARPGNLTQVLYDSSQGSQLLSQPSKISLKQRSDLGFGFHKTRTLMFILQGWSKT